jgi:hypothetical protein
MHDLTLSEVLKDPLIRQMLRADKVSLSEFAVLLDRAARARSRVFSLSVCEDSPFEAPRRQINLLQ